MIKGNEVLDIECDTKGARELREIAREVGAVLEGEYRLASGIKSGRYFDGKRITLWPRGARVVGEEVLELLKSVDVDAIGGLAVGAYPVVTAVAVVSEQRGKPIPSFVVRGETKKHGTQKQVDGHLKEGSRVAIVDDVVTTGGSIIKAIEAVEAVNCKVVKIIALVDRHEGGSDELRGRGYDFVAILGYRSASG